MILRPYQQDMIDQARVLLRAGIRRVLLQAPTGAGKTALSATMLGNAAARGKRCWFVCHRRELLDQTSKTFREANIRHAVIAAGYVPDPRLPVQLCGVASLARRLDRVAPPDLIVWDECHHLGARTWADIHRAYPNAVHIGLSATPSRLDGAGLSDYFDEMVTGPSIRWLIDHEYLCPYRLFAPSTIDTSKLRTRMGEYRPEEVAELVDRPSITGDVVREYLAKCRGQRIMIRAVSVKHSLHIAEQFRAAGVPSCHVDGTTETDLRRQCFASLRSGDILALSQVQIANEGVDIPAIECLADLDPTQSLSKAMQFWGRGFRYERGKVLTIFDHVGNVQRHGLPDADRVWTLAGREKKPRAATEAPVKICPACYAAISSASQRCPCGHIFEVIAREVEQVEGDLVEVDLNRARQLRLAMAELDAPIDASQLERTASYQKQLDYLVAEGRRRKMRNAEQWAAHVMTARMMRKSA